MTWTKCFQTLLVPVLLSALCGTSLAQVSSSTSNTPIKIIVPFTPGTGMDTIARTIQPRLAERTGQTVLVQNMPGASGNIGADFVAKSAADGTTLLMGANTMLIASKHAVQSRQRFCAGIDVCLWHLDVGGAPQNRH
jgi:tripartite-type tricarboxylate transporter receptor subunit TctC